MNNPIRAAVQRFVEVRRLLRLGGALDGGAALEIGCGRGVGAQLVLGHFGVASLDAFDLDPRMVRRARARSENWGNRVRLWMGDAAAIAAADATYDAVFDFGILHHVPQWRVALAEVSRVLKPGGRFFAEEVLRPFIQLAVSRLLFDHHRVSGLTPWSFRLE